MTHPNLSAARAHDLANDAERALDIARAAAKWHDMGTAWEACEAATRAASKAQTIARRNSESDPREGRGTFAPALRAARMAAMAWTAFADACDPEVE